MTHDRSQFQRMFAKGSTLSTAVTLIAACTTRDMAKFDNKKQASTDRGNSIIMILRAAHANLQRKVRLRCLAPSTCSCRTLQRIHTRASRPCPSRKPLPLPRKRTCSPNQGVSFCFEGASSLDCFNSVESCGMRSLRIITALLHDVPHVVAALAKRILNTSQVLTTDMLQPCQVFA